MTTATALIRQALGHLRVRAAGETVGGDDAADALDVLNTMIDAWRLESLNAYTTQTLTGTLAAGAQSISVGPSQALHSAVRPTRFGLGSTFRTAAGIDYPMRPVTEHEYTRLPPQTTALGPAYFHYRPEVPYGTLWFYPSPAAAVTLRMVAQVQVEQFAGLTLDYPLAPGYAQAIAYSLAEHLAAMFDVAVPVQVAAHAQRTRQAVKRLNHVTPQLNAEPEFGYRRRWDEAPL